MEGKAAGISASGIATVFRLLLHQHHSRLTPSHSQGAEIMQAALKRPQGQGLITACNHTSGVYVRQHVVQLMFQGSA
jgi:hypothetical protein